MKTKINILIRIKNSISALMVLVMMFASAEAFAQCTGTINITTTNADGGATIEYAIAGEDGVIDEISTSPIFSDVVSGKYSVYTLQYIAPAPVEWAVGSTTDNIITDGCTQLVERRAVIGCSCKDFIIDVVNQDTFAISSYALTDDTGVILYVSDYPGFLDVVEGNYQLYAIEYDAGDKPVSWTVGRNISSTTGTDCMPLVGPVAIATNCVYCTDGQVILLNVGAPGCPDDMIVDMSIKNGVGMDIPVGTPVSFYDGDPTMGGAILLGTYNTTAVILAGAIERINDVNIGGCSLNNEDIVYAVLGDDGSNALPLDMSAEFNNPVYDDCDNTNNKSAIKLKVRCGKYNSMIKK